MQSVSDDDVRKRLLEQTRFELAAKGVFRLGRCYIFWQSIPGLPASNWECVINAFCDHKDIATEDYRLKLKVHCSGIRSMLRNEM